LAGLGINLCQLRRNGFGIVRAATPKNRIAKHPDNLVLVVGAIRVYCYPHALFVHADETTVVGLTPPDNVREVLLRCRLIYLTGVVSSEVWVGIHWRRRIQPKVDVCRQLPERN